MRPRMILLLGLLLCIAGCEAATQVPSARRAAGGDVINEVFSKKARAAMQATAEASSEFGQAVVKQLEAGQERRRDPALAPYLAKFRSLTTTSAKLINDARAEARTPAEIRIVSKLDLIQRLLHHRADLVDGLGDPQSPLTGRRVLMCQAEISSALGTIPDPPSKTVRDLLEPQACQRKDYWGMPF